MVQKQAALSGGYRADSFADDDPLAELARIVGFEQPRSDQRSTPQAAPQQAAQVFNLEDELLREFETFEVPAPRAAPSRPAPPVAAQPKIEPDVIRQQPAAFDAGPAPQVPTVKAPAPPAAPVVLDEPFDWADELAQAEFLDVAPEAVGPVASQQPPKSRNDAYDDGLDLQSRQVPDFGPQAADDLIAELELAFGGSKSAPQQPAPSVSSAPAPRISLPLANFQAKPAQRPEPSFEPDFGPDFVEPEPALGASFVSGSTRSDKDLAVSREPFVPYQADDAWLDFGAAPAAEPARVAAPQATDYFRDFDLAASGTKKADTPPVPRAVEPDFSFSFADELAAGEDAFADAEQSVAWQPEVRQDSRPMAPAYAPSPAKAPGQASEPDLMGDGEFELMLEDLDLDLSELDFVEPVKVQPAVEPLSVRSPAASSIPAQQVAARQPVMEAAVPRPAPQPAETARIPLPTAAVAARGGQSLPAAAAKPAAPAGSEFDFRLPFDPNEIVEQDDQPETVAMVDVPEIAYAEPKEPPPRRSDFEFDIDTELAGLFDAPAPTPVTAAAADTVTFGGAAIGKPAAADDFDAFERALEEDFRRTLQDPKEKTPPGRISLDQVAMKRPRAGRPVLVALAASVVVAGAAAGGAYFWFGSSTSETAGTGEPRVIMADKDPVKVAPENPGGKSVPNQDKAVYDRVAGASVADPKQSSLISTNEEPVDVVQRTLLPDNLPLEGESEGETDAMATPVGETSDPRLLPEDQQTADASGAEQPDQSAIAPRKVRTMIVRPDGTLVAQDVPAAAPMGTTPTTAAAAPQTTDRPQQPAAAATPPTAPAPAPAAATPAATETAAAPAAPAAAAPASNANAPLPTSRPAEQPVNVVGRVTDQGNVTSARPQAPETTQASAPASAAPAANTPAAASVPAGSYVIQIASLPSEAEAQASYRSLSAKFSGVIGGRGVDIKAAEIAGKGTYYRVRIPAGSKAEAEALCGRYKAAGGSCLVAR